MIVVHGIQNSQRSGCWFDWSGGRHTWGVAGNLFSSSERLPDQLGGLLSDLEKRQANWDFEGVSGSTGARSHSVCSPSVSKENVKY